ncbi:YafY family transcriptional regulator [Aquimarina sp. TRL1]|uniref:helix-turn-helix transcriptional regulator n=1 Tax=Aquimarina sp. (strain TRL1) TaxID=2736252 RepID=UPI001589FF9A|nr:YafY family protein [Aquimarina sp. TRL1]QKX04001.1 YafY family transcriptional regulator [Aquimarina sp. TRL1]
MEKEKPRLVRLTSIMTQLQSGKLITARSIAEKHNISIRTVYRDIRTLEKSGIPIVTEEGRGYSLMEGYKLPPVMFSEEEANALITAAEVISANKDISLVTHYQEAIAKVKAVLRYSQKEKTELLENRIHVRKDRDITSSSNFLISLQSAITNYQLIFLDYLSLEDNRTQRTVEPFALYSTNENWILIAFCRLKNEFRSFRLDCIKEIKVVKEHFTKHPMTLQEYFEICKKTWEEKSKKNP